MDVIRAVDIEKHYGVHDDKRDAEHQEKFGVRIFFRFLVHSMVDKGLINNWTAVWLKSESVRFHYLSTP